MQFGRVSNTNLLSLQLNTPKDQPNDRPTNERIDVLTNRVTGTRIRIVMKNSSCRLKLLSFFSNKAEYFFVPGIEIVSPEDFRYRIQASFTFQNAFFYSFERKKKYSVKKS